MKRYTLQNTYWGPTSERIYSSDRLSKREVMYTNLLGNARERMIPILGAVDDVQELNYLETIGWLTINHGMNAVKPVLEGQESISVLRNKRRNERLQSLFSETRNILEATLKKMPDEDEKEFISKVESSEIILNIPPPFMTPDQIAAFFEQFLERGARANERTNIISGSQRRLSQKEFKMSQPLIKRITTALQNEFGDQIELSAIAANYYKLLKSDVIGPKSNAALTFLLEEHGCYLPEVEEHESRF